MKTIFLESHNIQNPYFGFGQFNFHLLKGLAKIDHPEYEIVVHATDISKLRKEFGNLFRYKKYHSLRRHNYFRIREKYDLWHSMNQNTKIEPYHRIPYLLTVHDVHFASENNQKRIALFKEKLDRATAITYISEFAKKETESFFEIPNVPQYVIYNGNPITDFLDTSTFESNFIGKRPFLYSIGDFLERKNFHSLVEMMRFLPDFNLIISGNNNKAYGEKIKNLINQHHLENQVFLTGRVDEMEKQYYLKNCTAFVFPSLREGFGLPPIEAMKFGKPVFLSNKTSLPEIGADAAYYWENFDPEYMKDILLEGLTHYKSQQEKQEKLLINRANFFDWEKAAKQYSEIYKSLI